MVSLHPYVAQLAEAAARRPYQRMNLKFRTLLKGFGYRKRSQAIVAEMHSQFEACGLDCDFSMEIPASLDDRVTIILAAPPPAALTDAAKTSPPTLTTAAGTPALPHSARDLIEIADYAVSATVEVFTESGLGSGFVVHPDGLVVTGRHVVEEDNYSVRSAKARLSDGRTVDAVIFRSHRQLDFALLWLLAGGPFHSLPIANPQALRHAQTVLAVGTPSGLSKTVTKGIVSNPRQVFRSIECIQTDAAIDSGNSGGPLVCQDGVVGTNLWGLGSVDSAKFAVPIDYLTEDIDLALSYGRDKCLKASYCSACGYTDYSKPTWYCRNCGVQWERGNQKNER